MNVAVPVVVYLLFVVVAGIGLVVILILSLFSVELGSLHV